MEKQQHTPGPWTVRESSLSVSVVAQNGDAVFHESYKRIPGVMEDARLIAAAPDLLEALEEIVSAADGDGWSQLDADLRKARAAIAKATGGDAA